MFNSNPPSLVVVYNSLNLFMYLDASPYGANPITLYSPSFGLNPKNAVNVEYNIPKECGNLTEPIFLISSDAFASEVVSHSPTPSTDNKADSLKGDV